MVKVDPIGKGEIEAVLKVNKGGSFYNRRSVGKRARGISSFQQPQRGFRLTKKVK